MFDEGRLRCPGWRPQAGSPSLPMRIGFLDSEVLRAGWILLEAIATR